MRLLLNDVRSTVFDLSSDNLLTLYVHSLDTMYGEAEGPCDVVKHINNYISLMSHFTPPPKIVILSHSLLRC